MIKTELHAHTSADTADRISHDAHELIARAGALGYGALAITLHDRWTDPAPLRDAADRHGLVLLSGIERTIEGKHVLIINGPRDAERVRTFADLAALRSANRHALVVAPHAFYPTPSALGGLLDRYPDLFDALEVNAMHVRGIDFNGRARAWAAAHGKPLVGNSDLHIMSQLGPTYSLVDAAARTPDGICEAIREGRVQVVTEPLGWFKAAWLFSRMVVNGGRHRDTENT
jgi:predicted metal-dependent phosphoesterase TrpH